MKWFFLGFILSITSISQAQECQHIQPIMQKLMANHTSQNTYNQTLENRVIDQYIKSLDAGKLYLLADDIAFIHKKMTGSYASLRKRDCKFLSEIQAVFQKRIEERAKFADSFLKSLKAVDKTVEINLDPKAREYSKTSADADAFQKKHLQLQLANILITDVKLDEAKEMLKRRYARAIKFAKDKKDDEIYANYLESFAHSLDPHTSYFSKKVSEDFRINMSLSLEGIGATLSSEDGFTVIQQLVPGGAAAKSGQLASQDKIMAVAKDGDKKFEPVYDMDLSDVVRLIRGPKGTKVNLKVLRKEGSKTKNFEVLLTREKINLEDEAAQITYMDKKVGNATKKIAVLTLPSFYADGTIGGRTSSKDVRRLLVEASKKKIDGLVFDLANNGGGSLDDAVKIAGMFFKTGNVVSHQDTRLADIDPTVYYSGPMVVLINRLSASASEIVSGALKDYKRAVIVGGDHTFGKGSVQQVQQLSEELGAIKFTVGLFYLPGGKSTQHAGVHSDVIFPSLLSLDDFGEKSLDYSLPPDSVPNFISKSAYENEGPSRWSPVTDEMIGVLKKKSSARVAKNKDFQKIEKDISEQKDKKLIKIADIFKDKDSEDSKKREKLKTMSRDERRKEYLESAEVQEAVNIALDLAKEIPVVYAGTKSLDKDLAN
ncbi:MAG: carboxy terminal-processing peptidase [Bdellovibrionales bacterium]|nr:carboxy terminal-processing peptidase [Bdellovibrionales bacterium]